MIVSFDLDDTLFVSDKNFKTESPLKFPMCIIYKEKLHAGKVALMKYICKQNVKLWIYTLRTVQSDIFVDYSDVTELNRTM